MEAIRRGHQSTVASEWACTLAKQKALCTATELYQGRAFGLAKRAAGILRADMGIISAGLGYVRGDMLIPPYDLTVRSSGPGSVVTRVVGQFDKEAWWCSVARGPYATPLLDDAAKRSQVLICLSRAYAELAADDLIKLPDVCSGGLRIFGLSIRQALPEKLQAYVMPYDERLSQVGKPGTRVDFPQRALLDHVENILPHSAGDLEKEKFAILERLKGRSLPSSNPQKRSDDETIKRLIESLVPNIGESSSRILAHLRNTMGLSCEQRRFSRLFKEATGRSPV